MGREEDSTSSNNSEFFHLGNEDVSGHSTLNMSDIDDSSSVDHIRDCVAHEIGKRDLVNKVELQAVEIELHKMGRAFYEKMDNIKDSVSAIERQQQSKWDNNNSKEETTSSSKGGYKDLHGLNTMINVKMAPMQQEIADLRGKNTELTNELAATRAELHAFRQQHAADLQRIADQKRTEAEQQQRRQQGNNDGDQKQFVPIINEWQHWDNAHIRVNDGRNMVFIGAFGDFWSSLRAKHPFRPARAICYYEVTIIGTGSWIRIGLSEAKLPVSSKQGVGDLPNSFGLGSDGRFRNQGKNERLEGFTFGPGDVIGCGVENAAIFFTKNGTIRSKSITLPLLANRMELFPAVSFWFLGTQIDVNFGQETFKWTFHSEWTVKG